MQVLLNASNLHTGGGVQVAASVLAELLTKDVRPAELTIWASTEVHRSLRAYGIDTDSLPRYEVINSHGLKLLWSPLAKRIRHFDGVFTLFGPLYVLPAPHVSLVGFAQPWILYPDNECYADMPTLARVKTQLKFWVQAQFFKQATALFVELDHVARGLIKRGLASPRSIHVVRNCLSGIYANRSLWKNVAIPGSAQAHLKLGFVGRNYPHKNTRIFPEVVEHLQRDHGVDARFYVTFNEQEWAACSEAFRACAVNVGALSVAQCPMFYRAMDAVVFPSLLECFSATPLEAMAMEKPLFASDRPFNRDICGKHAHYFDPTAPASAATAIAHYVRWTGDKQASLRAARDHAITFSDPASRAKQYIECLMEMALQPTSQSA